MAGTASFAYAANASWLLIARYVTTQYALAIASSKWLLVDFALRFLPSRVLPAHHATPPGTSRHPHPRFVFSSANSPSARALTTFRPSPDHGTSPWPRCCAALSRWVHRGRAPASRGCMAHAAHHPPPAVASSTQCYCPHSPRAPTPPRQRH